MGAAAPVLGATARAASAARSSDTLRVLTRAEARELDALTSAIVPTTETPGAHEAGVVWFIDQSLATFMASTAADFRGALASLLAAAGGSFAALDRERQHAFLTGLEATPYFGWLHYLTMAGLFTMPTYGGNRDRAGWRLIGFDHRHNWVPPFGRYDAE